MDKTKNLTPEELEKRKATNKKILKYGCLPVFGVIIIAVILSNLSGEQETKTDSYIKGLQPVDVYLNLENNGFNKRERDISEYGNIWTNTMQASGIDFIVETYSEESSSKVTSVRATATVDLSEKNITAPLQIFKFISTLQYEGAEPEKAAQWVEVNYNNDKASTIIGDVKFTMYAPSVMVRMMTMEKAK